MSTRTGIGGGGGSGGSGGGGVDKKVMLTHSKSSPHISVVGINTSPSTPGSTSSRSSYTDTADFDHFLQLSATNKDIAKVRLQIEVHEHGLFVSDMEIPLEELQKAVRKLQKIESSLKSKSEEERRKREEKEHRKEEEKREKKGVILVVWNTFSVVLSDVCII